MFQRQYEDHADLYSTVFEEPNMMNTIISFMTPKDVVHLMMSKGDFTHEPRFQDTVHTFLNVEKLKYIERMVKQEREQRICMFGKELYKLLDEFEYLNGYEEKIRQSRKVFDYVLKYKDIITSPEYASLLKSIENKLIYYLRTYEVFQHDALHYLDVICDVHLRIRPIQGTDDEFEEYIVTSQGDTIVI